MITGKSRRHGRLAGAALIALAAAVGGFGNTASALTRFSYTQQYPYYSQAAVTYAVSDGLLNAEIYGQAYPDQVDGAAAIARLIRMPGWHPEARLTTDPKPDRPNNGHRLVVIFNPAKAFPQGSRICQAPYSVTLAPPGSTLLVYAAFCAGNEVVAETFGYANPVVGLEDPGLKDMVNAMMLELLPPTDNLLRDRRNRKGLFGFN